jgi:alpha-L-arabinofuranosidase
MLATLKTLYGWRSYGDYGMVSDQNDRYPAYFVSKLVSRFTGSGDQVIQAATNYNLLAAYAVKRIDGSMPLLLINKGATNSLNAAVNLAGFVPQSAATVYSYGIPQDEAARTGAGSPDLATTTFSGVSTSEELSCSPRRPETMRVYRRLSSPRAASDQTHSRRQGRTG